MEQIWTDEETRLLNDNLDEDLEVLQLLLPKHSMQSISSKKGWLRKMSEKPENPMPRCILPSKKPKKTVTNNYRIFRDLDNAIGWAKEQHYAVIVEYTCKGSMGPYGYTVQHEYEVRLRMHPDFDEERYQRGEFRRTEIFYKTPKQTIRPWTTDNI